MWIAPPSSRHPFRRLAALVTGHRSDHPDWLCGSQLLGMDLGTASALVGDPADQAGAGGCYVIFGCSFTAGQRARYDSGREANLEPCASLLRRIFVVANCQSLPGEAAAISTGVGSTH